MYFVFFAYFMSKLVESGLKELPLIFKPFIIYRKPRHEHADFGLWCKFVADSQFLTCHNMQSFCCLPLRIDLAMEMLTLIYSISFLFSCCYYYPGRFTGSDLGCKMHWMCLIYTGKDLSGWHA